jgi:anti-sigma regulatory factor (Ser/Thr protein kinase)
MQSVVGTLNESYVATPASVAQARTRLAEFAIAAGAGPEQVDAVRLAASEAITNSVLHAYRGEPGAVAVRAEVVSDDLWIEILDDGCGLAPRADRPGLGLGLGLISQVSDDFAITSRPAGGTKVRIRFNLASETAEPADPRARPCATGRRPGHPGRRSGFTPSIPAA